MSEDPDDSEKTEEPTSRKLAQAREKGQVAKSQEVSNWFTLFALLIMIGFFLPFVAGGVGDVLIDFLAKPHLMPMDAGQLQDTFSEVLLALLWIMALPFGLFIVGALVSAFIQNGFILTTEQLKPKLSNIGLKKGFSKIFSMNAISEFIKGMFKVAIVTVIGGLIIWPERDLITTIPTMETLVFLEVVQDLAFRLVLGVLLVMTVIMVADIVYQRYEYMKKMRMTKQEVKDEHKQTEGDPHVKQRLRQIRVERSRQRMMAAVPEADVVVTNPTHYAIALKYDQSKMEAPRLVAKGVDSLAHRIRELAEEEKIPIVENPPLARALYAGVEIDQEIPPEHYKAVAEVIGFVMRVHGKLRSSLAR